MPLDKCFLGKRRMGSSYITDVGNLLELVLTCGGNGFCDHNYFHFTDLAHLMRIIFFLPSLQKTNKQKTQAPNL